MFSVAIEVEIEVCDRCHPMCVVSDLFPTVMLIYIVARDWSFYVCTGVLHGGRCAPIRLLLRNVPRICTPHLSLEIVCLRLSQGTPI